MSHFWACMRRAAQASRRRPQRGARGSCVPDHVRNPGKYTCYALDEPLIIGSGGGGGGGGDALGTAEQARGCACFWKWSFRGRMYYLANAMFKYGQALVAGSGDGSTQAAT